jgi:acetamidase/formamidase
MAAHTLLCTPATLHWGMLDADIPDVLTIAPGDSVEIETFSGDRSRLPVDRERFQVLERHLAVIEICTPFSAHCPNILTGPIHITGAEPGDLLAVQVEDVVLLQNWGWNQLYPGDGVLPELEDCDEVMTIPIDPEKGEVELPWGGRMPAQPFFGIMAVKPDHHDGPVHSLKPGTFGGNMDIRLLGRGATVFFPVLQKGAGFSVGDGHALQGDGEVCGTAVETSLKGRFNFRLIKKGAMTRFPFAEIPEHILTTAVDADLNVAIRETLAQAIRVLTARYKITEKDAYRHCSLCGDLALPQVVNVNKGVYLKVPVAALEPRP